LLFSEKNTVEAKAWLDKHYTDSVPVKSTVEKWFAKFKRGEISIEDDARSRRPKEAVSDENIKKVHKRISNDRKVKLIELAETLKIWKKRVEHIMYEYLDIQMLCAKWLPRVLILDQNQQRVDDSEQCSAIFNRNKDEFFRRYITMNITWLQSPIDNQPSGLNAMN
jgi:hypothetical protein